MEDKNIDIFGTKYTIHIGDTIAVDKDSNTTTGLCDSSNSVILIATKQPNETDMPKEEINKNIWHELIHAILNEGQYLNLSNDEPLVEWLARCIYSLTKQDIKYEG